MNINFLLCHPRNFKLRVRHDINGTAPTNPPRSMNNDWVFLLQYYAGVRCQFLQTFPSTNVFMDDYISISLRLRTNSTGVCWAIIYRCVALLLAITIIVIIIITVKPTTKCTSQSKTIHVVFKLYCFIIRRGIANRSCL